MPCSFRSRVCSTTWIRVYDGRKKGIPIEHQRLFIEVLRHVQETVDGALPLSADLDATEAMQLAGEALAMARTVLGLDAVEAAA